MGNVPLVTRVRAEMCRDCFLRPFEALFILDFLPTACAVGCILPPLRGYAAVHVPYNSQQ
jgi:hypothetical protein